MKDPQFTTREELEAYQLERLRTLIRRSKRNPFWAPRLEKAGIDESIGDLAVFRERMPLLTKAELAEDQAKHPPHGTNLGAPIDDFVRLHQTSASTGAPLRWLDTEENWSWMLDGWQRVFEAAGMTRSDRVFFAFSFGPFIGLWMAWCAAERMGCLCIPGGALNSANRARAIVANQADVLCCTPTYAARLGEVAREEGIDLAQAGLRAIVVGGEAGASIPAVREHIESLWHGARIYDHHGMTEVGPVSIPCPDRRDVLQVMEQAYLAEVIDHETGEPLDPNEEVGELVLTTLGRFDSPVLRYRTGDLVRPSYGEDSKGRMILQLEGGVIARADDMVVVRGVNLYPRTIDQCVRSQQGVAEYRVEIGTKRSMTELELLIEPLPEVQDIDGLCRKIGDAVYKVTNLRIGVRAVTIGGLPRFELKAKRWIRV